jgi:hypothetical protein
LEDRPALAVPSLQFDLTNNDNDIPGETVMKKILVLTAILIATAVLATTSASAQQNPPAAPTSVVEIFGCKFNANKGMNEVHSVNARYNAWADKNKMTDYTAFVATPLFHSADLPNDVLWLGAWPNAAAMARDAALSATKEGRDIDAAYDAVAKCPSHSLYAEVVVRQPKGAPPENGVATFRDCTVREGRTADEAIAALGQVAEYSAGRGSDEFSAVLFPLAGLPNNAHYTFKLVEGHASMDAFGKDVDLYTAGGFRRVDELLGRVVDCNSARVYTLERVRLAAPAPAPAAGTAR